MVMRFKIQFISKNRLQQMIHQYTPLGLFLRKEAGIWIAVDNTTGDVWMEEFHEKHQAIQWLTRELAVEVD